MPAYDFRCKDCEQRFTLFYKTYADYDTAEPACPECGSTNLARLISGVAIPRPSRDYSSMSPDEMLSVLESGDSRQVGEMFQQVGGDEMSDTERDATERLMRGESMEKVEESLQESESGGEDAIGG